MQYSAFCDLVYEPIFDIGALPVKKVNCDKNELYLLFNRQSLFI
jgi:hypothetical protein